MQIGMKLFSKIVTVFLLSILGVVPLLAAVSCQGHAQTTMRCGPECPMMAAIGKTSDHSRVGSSDFGRSCCEVAPGIPSSTSSSLAQQGSGEMTLMRDALASSAILPDLREEVKLIPPDWQPSSRLQSILCTYLI